MVVGAKRTLMRQLRPRISVPIQLLVSEKLALQRGFKSCDGASLRRTSIAGISPWRAGGRRVIWGPSCTVYP